MMLALAGVAQAQPFGRGQAGFADHGAGGLGAGGFGRAGGQGRMAGHFRERFTSANVTHDGRLTLQQARQAGMGVVARRFDQIDTAHKGYVTMDDISAFRRAMMQQRRAAQGAEDGPDGAGGAGGRGQAAGPPPDGGPDDGQGPPQ